VKFVAVLAAILMTASGLAADRDIVLATQSGDLKATLSMPETETQVTGVLILAGSGPTDRDGNGPAGLKTDAYKKLAGALVAEGFAVLRPDKRGVAASSGALKSENELRFDTYVEDAVLWRDKFVEQPLIANVVILGHSEGSLVAILAAQKTQTAGIVSLAGAGEGIGKTLRRQIAESGQPEFVLKEVDRILARLEAGESVSDVGPGFAALFRPSVQPYMISWLRYDPAVEIAKLTVPVAIVQGGTDLQVRVEDANLLAAARPDATLTILEGMNHVLVDAPADRAGNSATYTKPELPLSPGLVPALVAFLKGLPAP
jgi:uncharacterized protein